MSGESKLEAMPLLIFTEQREGHLMQEYEIRRRRGKALAAQRLLSTAAIAAIFLDASSLAATTVTNTYGGWAVTCAENSGKSRCVMIETLSRARAKRALASWAIALNEKKEAINRIVVPTGLNVSEGLTVGLNGKPVKVPYAACTPRECGAVFAMNAAVEQALNAEKSIPVWIVTATGKKFAFMFDAKEFPEAYAEFKKQTVTARSAQ